MPACRPARASLLCTGRGVVWCTLYGPIPLLLLLLALLVFLLLLMLWL